jgi:outer membrane receptor protein involved in Fe transport/serine/threonine protein kinase
MPASETPGPNRPTSGLPPHLEGWLLPPDWRWGNAGVLTPHRHAQEVIDALGRSLALVTAPDPAHHAWLFREARGLAHRSHPNIPTTYHFWQQHAGSRRGPGYLRRWITGETIGERLRRTGADTVPFALRILRALGSTLAYLHDSGSVHGALAPQTAYFTPSGRIWMLGWQWVMPSDEIPAGITPDARWTPWAPEWGGAWRPTLASDQWQLGAVAYAILTGELPQAGAIPPLRMLRPDCPGTVAELVDQMLAEDPAARFSSIAGMLRRLERLSGSSALAVPSAEQASGEQAVVSEEDRLRWATGDDYEVLAPLGAGTYGSVWRVRDLSLEREVALKMLHPTIARNAAAVGRFRREAQLAAQLQHPAIVPIFAWDSKGDVNWYIMELEEEGSVADLVARQGARTLAEIGPQVEAVLDGLAVAHANGIIHRDLKPENILIDRYRRWRIADFGIANAMGTAVAGASGTPAFAAPEQLLGEEQGVGTDLFAVAGIVIFALTGRTPFPGHDGPAILASQLAGRVDLEAFEEPLRGWLRRALAPDRADRFADAEQMRLAWRAVVRTAVREERRQRAGWRRLLRRLVGLGAFALATRAEAQGSRPAADSARADSAARRLVPVRVEVTRQATTLDRAPWAVGAQEVRDLRRGQATVGIDEALANIPGVVVSNRYNAAVDQRLSIRGAGSRANFGLRGVKVLLDGIPQSLPDGQSQLTNIDLAAIGRVEVLRGAASSLYGNGSGGVIAFTSDLSAPDPLTVSLRALSGSFGLAKTQARLSARAGRTVGALSVSRTTTDGFRQFSASDVRQLAAALDRAVSATTTLELRAAHAETPTAFNPGALTAAEWAANPDSAAANNIRRGARRAVTQRQASVRLRGTTGEATWSASVYAQGRTVDNPLATAPPAPAGATNGIYSTIDRRVTGARLDVARPLPGAWRPRLAAGIDLQRARDDRRNWRATAGARALPTDTLLLSQGETVTGLGPFAQLELAPTAAVTISLGGRYDRIGFAVADRFTGDGDDDSGARTMQAWSGHVGAVWRAWEWLTPYTNVATAFETPTTTELNARPDGLGGFNPDLGPQRIRTVEVGARGAVGARLTYDVAVFDAAAADALVQYLEAGGRAFFRNAGRTRSRGAELGVHLTLAPWVTLQGAWTRADYTFRTYRVPSATLAAPALDTLDGRRLAGVPRTTARLGARLSPGAFTLDVDHTLQAALWADDRNTLRVPGWGRGQLNVRAAWRGRVMGVAAEPFLAAQNALDTRYVGAVTLNGAFGRVLEPAPGRNWYVGLELGAPFRR